MHCNTCGSHVPDRAVFCPQCGNRIASPAVQRDMPVPPQGFIQTGDSQGAGDAGSVPTQSAQRRGRHGLTTLGLSILLLAFVFVFQIIGAAVAMFVGLDLEMWVTLFGAVGAILAIFILGGASLLRPSGSAFAFAWKEGWWCVAVSIALALYDSIGTLLAGETLVTEGWLLRSVGVLLLCLSVGVSEEGMFRGLLMGGMLDAFGKHKRSVVVVLAVSSVLFGAAHVSWGDLNYADPLEIVQAVLKTIQTGVYGFFLGAVVIRTGNLLGPMLLHAMDDFFLLLPSAGLYGETIETNYVSTGSDAIPTIILYVVIIILYLPLLWRAIKMLKDVPAPQYGAFHR